MPRLSSFFGIVIYMYFKDHAPPHFHAVFNGHEAEISIHTMHVLAGSLPRQQLAFVITWASLYQAELLRAWEAASAHKTPGKIPPLAKHPRQKEKK
jgi:hypothetical protein